MRRVWLFLALALIAGLAVAVQALRIQQVRVVGIGALTARTVVEASGLEIGDRILWERLTAAERRIQALPAVFRATAERELPGTVVLRVEERVPVVRLDGARDLATDREGFIFPAGETDVRAVLYGWKGRARSGGILDASSRGLLEAYARFPSGLRERGRRLEIAGGEQRSFTLTLAGGLEIRFGLLRDLDTKAAVADAILREERRRRLAYIDVRSPAAPVSRDSAPAKPSPSPTASPSPPG